VADDLKKIRVMIIEDSAVVRMLLEEIVGSDPRLEVAGAFASAEDGIEALDQISPDVISMDIRLTGMNGFEATQRIMAKRPTPIVVVSASVERADLKISINALKAGALAIVEKPVGVTRPEYREMAAQICTQLAIMSQVKLVRQRRQGPAVAAARPARRALADPRVRLTMLGIAASTGGPNALERLLGGLPADFPLPILVVQHITPTFLDGFAAWLEDVAPFPSTVARGGEVPAPGRIYVAPADGHLTLEAGRLAVDRGPPISGHRPSGTVLFASLARELGAAAAAVLLTGMGEDGAAGLRAVRVAGGYTIAEEESTAVVNGMPGAARRLDAVCQSLPLPEIARRLVELTGGGPGRRAEERREHG
jgi:two-component system, chemotaxis family, protein-glutamate methylesterase/glutaminase